MSMSMFEQYLKRSSFGLLMPGFVDYLAWGFGDSEGRGALKIGQFNMARLKK